MQSLTPPELTADIDDPLSISDITPVLLAGGQGKRLWPLSRRSRPKPYLKIGRKYSFLQKTLLRAAGMKPPLIVAAQDHRELILPQLHELNELLVKNTEIILEPCGKNTAPAIASAAHWLSRTNPPMLVMPSDHVIKNDDKFLSAVINALRFIDDRTIITFGVVPKYAATGYGYIRKGELIGDGVYKADHFHEKPDKSRAAFYLSKGEHLWNSGIFLGRAEAFLNAFRQFEPALSNHTYRALSSATRYTNSIYLDKSNYEKIEAISIDHAIMERTNNLAIIPVDMDWCDIGTWGALARHVLGI